MAEAGSGNRALRERMLAVILRAERMAESVVRRRAPDLTRAAVEPYRSYGTRNVLHVKGRVLQERRLARAVSGDPGWRHLLQTIRRAFSREIPLAPIEARWGGHRVEGTADSEGYFHLRIEEVDAIGVALWEPVEVRVCGATEDRIAIAQVLVPPADAQLAIVSDIDDTVIRTDATSLVRMLRTVLLENAHVRLPFEGVAAFYRALHRGRNPIFYVSSGPWNLY